MENNKREFYQNINGLKEAVTIPVFMYHKELKTTDERNEYRNSVFELFSAAEDLTTFTNAINANNGIMRISQAYKLLRHRKPDRIVGLIGYLIGKGSVYIVGDNIISYNYLSKNGTKITKTALKQISIFWTVLEFLPQCQNVFTLIGDNGERGYLTLLIPKDKNSTGKLYRHIALEEDVRLTATLIASYKASKRHEDGIVLTVNSEEEMKHFMTLDAACNVNYYSVVNIKAGSETEGMVEIYA